RNYAKTAKLAIIEGNIIEFIERYECLLDFSYEKINEVETILIDGNDELQNKDFNERVTYRVKISLETLKKLKDHKDILVIQ
ncbi:MAG: YigZ family protein, partial [Cetobacterium sp.]